MARIFQVGRVLDMRGRLRGKTSAKQDPANPLNCKLLKAAFTPGSD
jgi:hypothetical protein